MENHKKLKNDHILIKNNLKFEHVKCRSLCRFFSFIDFMEASTSNFHILLEFSLSTQVKPASTSGEVCVAHACNHQIMCWHAKYGVRLCLGVGPRLCESCLLAASWLPPAAGGQLTQPLPQQTCKDMQSLLGAWRKGVKNPRISPSVATSSRSDSTGPTPQSLSLPICQPAPSPELWVSRTCLNLPSSAFLLCKSTRGIYSTNLYSRNGDEENLTRLSHRAYWQQGRWFKIPAEGSPYSFDSHQPYAKKRV